MTWTGRRLGMLGATLGLVAVLSGCSGEADEAASPDPSVAQTGNPFQARPGYADPGSRAARAAARAEADGEMESSRVLARLAAVPAGIWLTPEQHPPGSVGPYVAGVVAAAGTAGRLPLFVVYGIPDRDCTGGFSEGGLAPSAYGPWVAEIAAAAAESDGAVAVLEPDALAAAVECRNRAQRVRLLTEAVDSLRDAGVPTYVDGGHSNWISPASLAGLMRAVGVESVRGFATNVANYQTDDDERDYAGRLSRLLGGAHFVVDSGRNGHGPTAQWCNPTGRAFGTEPAYVDDGTPLDAFLWVKPPGESDGECGGGPPAGELWPERALAMAAASGW